MKVVKSSNKTNRINKIEGEKTFVEVLIYPHFSVRTLKEALAACQSPTGINGLLDGCSYQPFLFSLQALG